MVPLKASSNNQLSACLRFLFFSFFTQLLLSLFMCTTDTNTASALLGETVCKRVLLSPSSVAVSQQIWTLNTSLWRTCTWVFVWLSLHRAKDTYQVELRCWIADMHECDSLFLLSPWWTGFQSISSLPFGATYAGVGSSTLWFVSQTSVKPEQAVSTTRPTLPVICQSEASEA